MEEWDNDNNLFDKFLFAGMILLGAVVLSYVAYVTVNVANWNVLEVVQGLQR